MAPRKEISLLSRVRRHHALEHATIRILNRRFPHVRLAGWSAPGGFYIRGAVTTAQLQTAIAEAVARFAGGERHLAVHPRCGTNLVTAGLFGIGYIYDLWTLNDQITIINGGKA